MKAPCASQVGVPGRMRLRTSALEPTARKRPLLIANASARGCTASTVTTRALKTTSSGALVETFCCSCARSAGAIRPAPASASRSRRWMRLDIMPPRREPMMSVRKMSLVSRLLGLLWHLPAPITRDIGTQPLRIPMRDGPELLADRYYSRNGPAQPTVLIRSCYGRGTFLKPVAALFVERGMQVVIQSCRGTDGSQGTFRPFFDEENDGEDTVEWIARQSWFNGDLALWGISYLGNTAWAVANSGARDRVKAIGLHVTLTNFRDRTYAFGGYTLLSCIEWTATMLGVLRNSGRSPLAAMMSARKTRSLTQHAMAALPLRKADRVLTPEG